MWVTAAPLAPGTCRRVLEGEPAVTQLATADQADPSSGKSNGEGFETGRPGLSPAGWPAKTKNKLGN